MSTCCSRRCRPWARRSTWNASQPDHFDYVVIDEFHHAAAPTYRRLLQHLRPRFLLGLTATPERTDQSDILSLCDDNLVYSRHLFDGIELGLLCPFHYFGIYDETVDYREIPWRNGRFDPQALSNKLATQGRARHALRHWREQGRQRTLAFCVSRKHADFMAERFRREGIRAEAVYRGSTLERSAALEQLEQGSLQVIFSVDLFNEGVDLPAIDTVMMLRPTESKVLFLQQLGRGLRLHPDKERLVVLDFIGNHQGFLNKPQALFEVGSSYRQLAEFGRRARDGELALPPGCFANYDLAIIEFLIRLQGKGPATDYQALRDSLSRRPTLAEFYRSGSSLAGPSASARPVVGVGRGPGRPDSRRDRLPGSPRGLLPRGRDHQHDQVLQGRAVGVAVGPGRLPPAAHRRRPGRAGAGGLPPSARIYHRYPQGPSADRRHRHRQMAQLLEGQPDQRLDRRQPRR